MAIVLAVSQPPSFNPTSNSKTAGVGTNIAADLDLNVITQLGETVSVVKLDIQLQLQLQVLAGLLLTLLAAQ